MYVFLGDEHAMIDFVRIMERLGLNRKGEYVVIAVRNSPFDPAKAKKSEYLLKGKLMYVLVFILLSIIKNHENIG